METNENYMKTETHSARKDKERQRNKDPGSAPWSLEKGGRKEMQETKERGPALLGPEERKDVITKEA